MQNNSLSLEEVKSHFEHWRTTRTKQREKIPQHLWDKVKSIIDHYSLVNIAQVLRLNTAQIKDNLRIQEKVTFAETKIDPPIVLNNRSFLLSSIKGQTYSIELQRANGSVLRISSLPPESINKIISQFME